MTPLFAFSKIAIYALMAAGLLAAIGTVTLRNLFHAALCLVAVLLSVAGIYVVLHAEFLAMVQILIYVGAVMTLVIFAIMLTERMPDASIPQSNRQGLFAFAAVIVLLTLVLGVLLKTPWPVNEQTLRYPAGIVDIAAALLGTYVFPFEVISVLLIAVLIGAIVIAKRDKAR